MQILEVIAASGLKVRRLPDGDADPMVAMPQWMRVHRIDNEVWNGGWLRIRAQFSDSYMVEGYSWGEYLRSIGPPEVGQPVSGGALSSDLSFADLPPLMPDEGRRRHLDELHTGFRARLNDLTEALKVKGLRFKLFELYRTPSRQQYLFAQGRSRDGAIVTHVQAWRSKHNYGLAADLVLDIPNVGLWETGKIDGVHYDRMWSEMRKLARRHGLRTLSRNGKDWDLPHVEMPDVATVDLQAGRFPGGGGETWARNLERMVAIHPDGAPSLDFLERRRTTHAQPMEEGASETTSPTDAPDRRTEGQAAPDPSDIFTVDFVRPLFHPTVPKSNIETNLPVVLRELAAAGLGAAPFVVIALATIKAETAGFKSIAERESKYNTSPGGPPFGLYDNREDIGNQGPGDGERFRGRGFLQLTGRDNYKRYGDRIGIDLVADPDRALEPTVAARLLAEFLKDQKARLEKAWKKQDWKDARKAVNGGSHGLDRFTDLVRAARSVLGSDA